MRYREQGKYIDALKNFEKKMTYEELKDFRMLKKRHTDDEDLDSLSLKRLKGYYEKYYVNREKKNYDLYFTKNENKGSEENIHDLTTEEETDKE
jgi:hypothetical protein